LRYADNAGKNTMIRVLGIVSSPRKGGNTETLTKIALEEASKEGADTNILHLSDYTIQACDSCLSCLSTKRCRIEDDLEKVYQKMIEANGIILASPVYHASITPQLKALMDRAGFIANAKGKAFKGKIGGAITVASRAGHLTAFSQILLYLWCCGFITPGGSYYTVATADEPDDVLKDNVGVKLAKELGRNIAQLSRKLS